MDKKEKEKEKETENKDSNKNKESEKFTIAEIRQYYADTLAKFKEIDSMLEKLESEASSKTDKEKKDTLEAITSKIKLYREEFYNVMEFLPGYDKLQYSKNYDEELEKVNKLRNKLFPKKNLLFPKQIKSRMKILKKKRKKKRKKNKN